MRTLTSSILPLTMLLCSIIMVLANFELASVIKEQEEVLIRFNKKPFVYKENGCLDESEKSFYKDFFNSLK